MKTRNFKLNKNRNKLIKMKVKWFSTIIYNKKKLINHEIKAFILNLNNNLSKIKQLKKNNQTVNK